MQDSGIAFLGSVASAWETHGEYVQLLLGLLFGWLVLNWLSTTAARVDGLSMAVRDLRKDLEEVKEGQRPRSKDQGPGGD